MSNLVLSFCTVRSTSLATRCNGVFVGTRGFRSYFKRLLSTASDSDENKWMNVTKFQGRGVMADKKELDVVQLVNTFTAPALASALHDREQTLGLCCSLLKAGNLDDLMRILEPFRVKLKTNGDTKREKVPSRLDKDALFGLRRVLSRLPRQVSRASHRRASVLVPLCEVNEVPSILFTLRSDKVSKFKNQVCFPGGMVDAVDDNVTTTSLREMKEEMGIDPSVVETLGVLRCDWSEVEALTHVAVTPVVGFIGELSSLRLEPNPDEVQEHFAVPLAKIVDRSNWMEREYSAPIFTGGPHVIWGLTAYILKRLAMVWLQPSTEK